MLQGVRHPKIGGAIREREVDLEGREQVISEDAKELADQRRPVPLPVDGIQNLADLEVEQDTKPCLDPLPISRRPQGSGEATRIKSPTPRPWTWSIRKERLDCSTVSVILASSRAGIPVRLWTTGLPRTIGVANA